LNHFVYYHQAPKESYTQGGWKRLEGKGRDIGFWDEPDGQKSKRGWLLCIIKEAVVLGSGIGVKTYKIEIDQSDERN
jgi:hypothetical protein